VNPGSGRRENIIIKKFIAEYALRCCQLSSGRIRICLYCGKHFSVMVYTHCTESEITYCEEIDWTNYTNAACSVSITQYLSSWAEDLKLGENDNFIPRFHLCMYFPFSVQLVM
jgi:hypothetical protein